MDRLEHSYEAGVRSVRIHLHCLYDVPEKGIVNNDIVNNDYNQLMIYSK